ncbi:HAMP domain-containing sensor histidine kinase [Exiguobacterium antarcticum]|uniref:Heme sensor protein HssS n=1 Tax=Exiguobacterium antarcticum TaxID=132920 RepID=A0ABT6R4N1_9BACL|nr:HAMP domain-containing sensor histidine kinase [Exiguobacterium antarcticum]MDI3235780.1 HAMP domain-containing sensor histidine kinase [Exiguobacterium antarcticum]
MKHFFNSISGRFFLILFGLLLLPLLIPLLLTFFFQFDSVRSDVTKQLEERTDTVERLMVEQKLPFSAARRYVEQSIIETTEVSSGRLETRFSLSAADQETLRRQGGLSIAGTVDEGPLYIRRVGERYLVSTPNPDQNLLTNIRNSSLLGMGLTVAVAFFLTWFAVRLVTRRIKKISDAAIEVTQGNYEVQISDTGTDEVAQLIQNFNQMTVALQRNEYLAKDLAAAISHELKTPIASIHGFSHLLAQADLPEDKKQRYIAIIEQESGRLSRLTSNLVRLSRLDHQTIIQRKPYRLDEQMRHALLLLESSWTDKNLILDLELAEVTVVWEEELMQQVWLNLLQNAIYYSPPNGLLSIRLTQETDIMLTITDQGKGIPESEIPFVFDRFYQGETSRTTEGHGLGLSIVKRIVDLHGGTVTLDSKPGQGTCVLLQIPDKGPA